MHDPSQGDSAVEVAREAKPEQRLGFTLRGQGVITEAPGETASNAAQQQDQQQAESQPQSAPAGRDNRPGGGLGVPIDAPDALQKYRWPILFGFAVLLAIGGWVVTKRQPMTSAAAGATSGRKVAAATGDPAANLRSSSPSSSAAVTSSNPVVSAPASKSSMLLEALKEELFQLEVEKKQGKITPAEYEKARAALDQTLDRALKRQQG